MGSARTISVKKVVIWAAFSVAAASLAVAGAYAVQFRSHDFGGPQAWSEFGSYFGGIVGPVFAAAGFVGIVVTLWLQKSVIANTQAELDAQYRERRVDRAFSLGQELSKIIDELLEKEAPLVKRSQDELQVIRATGLEHKKSYPKAKYIVLRQLLRFETLVNHNAFTAKEMQESKYTDGQNLWWHIRAFTPLGELRMLLKDLSQIQADLVLNESPDYLTKYFPAKYDSVVRASLKLGYLHEAQGIKNLTFNRGLEELRDTVIYKSQPDEELCSSNERETGLMQ